MTFDPDALLYPGETISTSIWRSGNDLVFRCTVEARHVRVLDHGIARLR